jgi:hypothetical protein
MVSSARKAISMRRRKRLAAISVLGSLVMLMVATLATPASAEVIQSGCTGSAEFSNGTKVNESTPLSEVFEVPAKDDNVIYAGAIDLEPADEPEPFGGDVSVRLPLGGSWVAASWPVPPGETESVSDTGTYSYEVPSFLPRGTGGMEVTAFHQQRGVTCEVAVTLALAGSPGPAALIGTAGTLVFGLGVGAAGSRKGVSR